MRDIYLILENNTVFKGKSFGAYKEVIGEVVFSTSMVGYVEALTDPSYHGQIIVQTFPQIGNYGVMKEDFASDKIQASAYVVREKCDNPSNFRCEGTLEEWMEREGIPGIYGIDTRKLTKIIRENGVMNGKISFTCDFDKDIEKYTVIDSVNQVSSKEEAVYKAENPKYNVVVFDFGSKMNIISELIKRDCNVTVVPANTDLTRIKEINPDGIILSSGPGDPLENKEITDNIKKICELKIPMFAIGLGHQILALAKGGETEKLKYGHRGGQPIVNTETKHVFATSQNHGYIVKADKLDSAVVTYVNANDKTCEGLSYKDMPAFSIQFRPETVGDPLDGEFMFDKFVKLMEV